MSGVREGYVVECESCEKDFDLTPAEIREYEASVEDCKGNEEGSIVAPVFCEDCSQDSDCCGATMHSYLDDVGICDRCKDHCTRQSRYEH